MFDIFFVSYEEANAEENWKIIKSRFATARRVHGIKGISAAHRICATKSFTSMFWTVDGDTTVDYTWDFSYVPPEWDQQYLHLWYSRNPLNTLVYGYGAVKLWPKNRVLEHDKSWIDFTTSVGNIKIMNQCIATTNFNSTPFETWKSAFRESVKLQKNIIENPNDIESIERLNSWMLPSTDSQYSEWCVKGVNDAQIWYKTNSTNLLLINDFSYLKSYFEGYYAI
jgi:hypothetical protein